MSAYDLFFEYIFYYYRNLNVAKLFCSIPTRSAAQPTSFGPTAYHEYCNL